MGKLIATLKQFWASLPHLVQAGIILFVTSAGTTLGQELKALWLGNEAFTWLALQHDIGLAVFAGFAAVRTFYMLPNGSGKRLLAQAQAQNGTNPAPKA
jgi:hypothetical protein